MRQIADLPAMQGINSNTYQEKTTTSGKTIATACA
jgi:hypothetical protein